VFDSTVSNPRAWANVSALLKAARKQETPPRLLQAVVSGCVGPERAAAFFRFLDDHVQPLKAQDILTAYAAHRAMVRSWVKKGKLDLVEGTLLNVEKHLQSSTNFKAVRADANLWKHLGRFLRDLPGDLRARAETFFRDHKYPLPGKPRRSA